MLSKWQIWDFFRSYKRETLNSYEGILALNTFDSICLKLVKDFLIRDLKGKSINYKMASEVTKPWIEDEFKTLNLFGSFECFFIHQAQDLQPEIIDLLLNLDITGRFIILSFENEQTSWKKMVKDEKVLSLIIDAPPFWELGKLLDFVCGYLKLPLSYESKNWILDSLENNLSTFYNSCCLIKLNFPESREVQLVEVKELLKLEKLDQFQLASMLSRKKLNQFYEKLVTFDGDFEKMRGFFMFMQSHLIKLADTSYLSKKARLTQYDKDLQNASKLWKSTELMALIETFNHWELLCKKKDNFLWHEIKEAQLKAFTVNS